MGRLSNYEKVVLGMTASFVLFTGLWFWNQNHREVEYQITTIQRRQEIDTPLPQPEEQQKQPDSLLPGEKININTADEYDLQRLPGIGEKRARDIITYREQQGGFHSVEELDQVSGIGPAILKGLLEYACVETG